MKKSRVTGVVVVLLALSILTTMALGEQETKNEALALGKANISLSQAIDNALSAVPGKALSAELDDEENTPVFVVEVVTQGQTYEVTLDTQSGAVLKKHLDREDRDDEDGEDRDQ